MYQRGCVPRWRLASISASAFRSRWSKCLKKGVKMKSLNSLLYFFSAMAVFSLKQNGASHQYTSLKARRHSPLLQSRLTMLSRASGLEQSNAIREPIPLALKTWSENSSCRTRWDMTIISHRVTKIDCSPQFSGLPAELSARSPGLLPASVYCPIDCLPSWPWVECQGWPSCEGHPSRCWKYDSPKSA